jgi:hypothetical protein
MNIWQMHGDMARMRRERFRMEAGTWRIWRAARRAARNMDERSAVRSTVLAERTRNEPHAVLR